MLKACGVGRKKPGGPDWLLRGVCLELSAGDRLFVTGPTGAGKTLLLRALALLDPLDEGVILWRGEHISAHAVPSFRRHVAYFHQHASIFEGSVESNLRRPFLLAANRGRAFDLDRVSHYLNVLRRGASFLQQLSRDLSGGERQIVALIRTLQLDPTVLLLDEPTASLDGASSRIVENLILGWLDDATTERALIWVSHNQDQARRMASRTLAMQAGSVKQGD
jgi:putative ABC transport system ATP-binding protein